MEAQIPVGETPVGIAIDETANRIYVANQHSGTINVIDGGSSQVVATWHPQLGNVWKLAVDPALQRLYVTIPAPTIGSFTGLEVLDSTSGAYVARIAASAAEDVAVNPKTHHVFMADSGNGTVTVIDGTTNMVLNKLMTGTGALALAVDPSSGLVYVSNAFDASIGVFSDQPGAPPPPPTPAPPAVSPGGIVSGASATAGLSVGAICDIYGANLASSTIVANSVPWPTELGGVIVYVNSFEAPIYFVSPGQIAFLLPWQVLGLTQVTIGVSTASGTQVVTLAPEAPSIFSMNEQGTGQGAIEIANSVLLAAPVGSAQGLESQPATRGGYITIYCTGLGDVTNRPASGGAASGDPLSTTVVTPTVTIGGVAVQPIFSGLAPGYVGLYQVNVQVPANALVGSAVPVSIDMGGESSNTVTIAVQ